MESLRVWTIERTNLLWADVENVAHAYEICVGLVVVLRLFHAGHVSSCPCEESGLRTVALITAVFAEVDAQMGAIPTHPEAHLWPSTVVTLGL